MVLVEKNGLNNFGITITLINLIFLLQNILNQKHEEINYHCRSGV